MMEMAGARTAVLFLFLSVLFFNGCAIAVVGAAGKAAEEITEDERMMDGYNEKEKK